MCHASNGSSFRFGKIECDPQCTKIWRFGARRYDDLVQEDMMICCYRELQNRSTHLDGLMGKYNTFFVYGLKLRKQDKFLAHGSPATNSEFTN